MSSQFNPVLPPDGTEQRAFFRSLREAVRDLVHHLKGFRREGDAFAFDNAVAATTLESTVATGTAPLTVASTTKVANLNADLLDDQSGAYYLARGNHTGTQLASTISDFAAAARALVSVLDGTNIDLSYDSTTGVITAALTGQVGLANGGTAVDGSARTANTVFSGPSSGGAGNATFRVLVPADIPSLTASKISDFTTTARAAISILDGTNIDLSYNSSTGVVTASITGTLARANLPPEIAYEDESNTFTQVQRWNAAVAMGNTPDAGTAFRLNLAAALTGTTQTGMFSDPIFQSGATVAGRSIHARVRTAAAVFTCPKAAAVYIQNASLGAGSIVTEQCGIDIEALSGGGTNIAIRTGANACLLGGEVTHAANTSLGAGTGSYGGGAKVIFIANAGTLPTSNPTGGGVLYEDSGSLKHRGSSGTIQLLAAP